MTVAILERTLSAPQATPVAGALPPRVIEAARATAEAVDRDGRFPAETVAALKAERLLGALLPVQDGGLGQGVAEAAATCYALGRYCSASAMILAMHHSQAACLPRDAASTPWLRAFKARVGHEQLLLASVTSEVGVGGAMRTSLCAVERAATGGWTLRKQAPSVSYGAYADALLVTARAHPDADRSDQVLVVVPNSGGVLQRTSEWDTMGMRGTCSDGFLVQAAGCDEQIIPAPFAQISMEAMVPVSHLAWTSAWCGIAADAVNRARRLLRGKMKTAPGGMPDGADRLVRAVERLRSAEALVGQMLHAHAPGRSESFSDAASLNMLKTAVSEACVAVVTDCLAVCGFAGYANRGPYSVSRHFRDLQSAPLMIHNDRVRGFTSRLLMLQAPALGIC